MGPHRLHFWDAGGGRETGNLFGVALLSLLIVVDVYVCTVLTGHPPFFKSKERSSDVLTGQTRAIHLQCSSASQPTFKNPH